MIELFSNDVKIECSFWTFPGGEVGCKILSTKLGDKIKIKANISSTDELLQVINLCDAITRINQFSEINLVLPYLPYARQDRVCHAGESFALEVFVRMISRCTKVDTIVTYDVHSPVAEKLFLHYGVGFENIPQHVCAENLPNIYKYLIAPDAGSAPKISEHQFAKNGIPVVYLGKTRTPTGIVYDDLPHDTISGECIVIDDCCDGGATFLSLAEMLRRTQPNIGSLDLYVTHGIFSKGTVELYKFYDKIFTYNNIGNAPATQL
jgi:ribose-phosphate pyrophosphokinase